MSPRRKPGKGLANGFQVSSVFTRSPRFVIQQPQAAFDTFVNLLEFTLDRER
jgi:hypothetical protein